MTHVHCLSFDFAGSIGVSHIRTTRSGGRAKLDAKAIEILDLDCITLPEAVESEFNGKNAGVRARIHDPAVWTAASAMFRELLLSTFSKVHKTEHEQRLLVIAYEQVMFASSVFWAQFYGGLVATMFNVVRSEFNDRERADITIQGVNVSRIKSELTGDSGAPKDVVAAALRGFIERAPDRVRHKYNALAPIARKHDACDALATGITALRIASGRWASDEE